MKSKLIRSVGVYWVPAFAGTTAERCGDDSGKVRNDSEEVRTTNLIIVDAEQIVRF
jgi:hypothetical protein